ncbi:MAG: Ig-like domain-containing protein [Eubacteriaceae bacterium]|nr:Ig-like domain-containing protein [Eubacteriaceae bacterium]
MKKKVRNCLIKIFTAVFCVGIIMGSVGIFFCDNAFAETPGRTLNVRVGYFGDDKDYRVKAKLTRDDLEACGTNTYYYSNVTRVGTVMGTVARGVTILDMLEAAGIDPGSVQTINLRTTDGTKVNNWFVSLNMDQWVNKTRYYYPKLRGNYENEDGNAVIPKDGSLSGAETVPAILAIESYATKSPSEKLEPGSMDERRSYRFCVGQTAMQENTACGDWSSMNSAYWIFGVDVTLYGKASDVTGISLDLSQKNLKVGSKEKITATLKGQELFQDKVSGNVTWSSSDTSIATVDKHGVVTIKKKGKVTITATSDNGVSRSVVINGVDGKKKTEKENGNNTPAVSDSKNRQNETGTSKGKIRSAGIREIVLGGSMYDREKMAGGATALDAQKRDKRAAPIAVTGAMICAAGGAVYRILMYLKEVK